jgi:hypothetical protein
LSNSKRSFQNLTPKQIWDLYRPTREDICVVEPKYWKKFVARCKDRLLEMNQFASAKDNSTDNGRVPVGATPNDSIVSVRRVHVNGGAGLIMHGPQIANLSGAQAQNWSFAQAQAQGMAVTYMNMQQTMIDDGRMREQAIREENRWREQAIREESRMREQAMMEDRTVGRESKRRRRRRKERSNVSLN